MRTKGFLSYKGIDDLSESGFEDYKSYYVAGTVPVLYSLAFNPIDTAEDTQAKPVDPELFDALKTELWAIFEDELAAELFVCALISNESPLNSERITFVNLNIYNAAEA